MSLLQQTRILPNQRLDLSDYRQIEDFSCADFKAIHKNVWTNNNFVVSGFEATIGTSVSELLIHLAGSSCILGQDDGVFFVGAASQSPLLIDALTDNAVNYIELTIGKNSGGADSRAFWDETANGGQGGEFSQIIDTYVFLEAKVSINTSNFTGDANKLKICKVTMSSGSIVNIEDSRNLLYRLGRAGNPGYSFPWPNRFEPSTTSFSGGDKDVANLKQWMDAVMDGLREIKGTSFWYEAPTATLPGAFTNPALSVISGSSSSAKFAWDGDLLSITDNALSPLQTDVIAYIRIFSSPIDLALSRQSAGATIAIADKEVLWVELPDPQTYILYDGVGNTSTNYRRSSLGSVPLKATSFWLAYREGSRLYVRGLGELNPGESIEISDQVPEALMQFLGFDPEIATSVPYTATPNMSVLNYDFTNASDLVTAISSNTANINALGLALDTNVYDETMVVVSGAPANDNEITGPVSAPTVITIPLDSRDSNLQEQYIVGAGLLAVYLNGQLLELGQDWSEIGLVGSLSSTITILQDLVIDDRLIFRIGSLGGFNVGAAVGEANTASNLGAGSQVFKQKSGINLEFRTLVAGTNITVVEAANTITISASAGGGGADTVVDVSSDYTALGTDDHIRVDASGGIRNITLQDASTVLGKKYVIKKIDSSVNVVNVLTVLSQQIDGLTTRILSAQYQTISIISTGLGWDIQ